MRIINIIDKNRLNEFIIRAGGCFLESYEWGEFQEKMGAKIWRLGVVATKMELGSGCPEPSSDRAVNSGDEQLVAAATLIKKRLPFGKSYFYSPRGPVAGIMNHESRIMNFLFKEIERIAKQEGAIFLRFESSAIIHNSLFIIHKTIDVQPSKTLILDLTKSEDELLKAMHEKTRYNIRLAEKKGVKIIEASAERFNDFWELMKETGGRDDFRLHGKDYYKAMLKITNGHELITNSHRCFIKLFLAEYEGKTIAVGIFSFFSDTATYLHGGSANEFRNVMAPYLLQWHIIKLAKNLGFKHYDFFGIDEKKWPGVTRFKKGFNGDEINYPGTFDAVFDKGWYNVYKIFRRVSRIF